MQFEQFWEKFEFKEFQKLLKLKWTYKYILLPS